MSLETQEVQEVQVHSGYPELSTGCSVARGLSSHSAVADDQS